MKTWTDKCALFDEDISTGADFDTRTAATYTVVYPASVQQKLRENAAKGRYISHDVELDMTGSWTWEVGFGMLDLEGWA